MKRKQLICAVLALVLLISAQPAAMATSNQRSTVINTLQPKLPTINVTVPGKGSVVINPLGLPVSIGGTNSSDQIVCTPRQLVNKSDIALSVDISVTGAVNEESDMRLVTSPTGGSGTAKEAFIYFEIHQADVDDLDHAEWDDGYSSSNERHILVERGIEHIAKDVFTLPPKVNGEVAPGGYAPFRLAGDAVRSPDSAWTKKDGITVTIVFTFEPIAFTK